MNSAEVTRADYTSVIGAQIDCINELSEKKQERLRMTHFGSNYQIEKSSTGSPHFPPTVLFQGKGRACHLFLNGYIASYLT
ncbi:hypothetical protein AB1F87_001958 [Vibrio mimicus]